MFLTERLYMRPGCPADAPDLQFAITDEAIVRNLSSAPWPYALSDALDLCSREFDPTQPRLFIFTRAASELIGVIGLDQMPDGEIELGYWIARRHWNRGYAEEAALQMIEIARRELRLQQIVAGHFLDNPASGRVLEKLGFTPAAELVDRQSLARGGTAPCRMYRLQL